MPTGLDGPDTSLRQPWGVGYSFEAPPSRSRELISFPAITVVSLDVDIYRSGQVEMASDKQAKVRLPGKGCRPGAPEPDPAHGLGSNRCNTDQGL